MSIASEINRLRDLRDRLRTKILALGLDSDPQLDLDDCVGKVEGISGTQNLTTAGSVYNVAGKQYAQIYDRELVPGNIVRGVTILGVEGTAAASGGANIQREKTLLYGTSSPPPVVYPDRGYDGIAKVTPELTDANRVLTPGNIKNGVTIMGVTGSYVTPTEAKAPTLTDLKEAGITDHSVDILPSSGKHLSQVTIPKITAAIDTNLVEGNIRSGVTILNVTGNYSGGGSSSSNWIYSLGTIGNMGRRLTFTSPLIPSSIRSAAVSFQVGNTIGQSGAALQIGNLTGGYCVFEPNPSNTNQTNSYGIFEPFVLIEDNKIYATNAGEFQYWAMYFANGVFYIDMPVNWIEVFGNSPFNSSVSYCALIYVSV